MINKNLKLSVNANADKRKKQIQDSHDDGGMQMNM